MAEAAVAEASREGRVEKLSSDDAKAPELDDKSKQLLQAAVEFLKNPQVAKAPMSSKIQYLHTKLKLGAAGVKLELDSEGAKSLVAKYDDDESGMIEFDEFKKLAMAMSAVNVKLDDPKAVEAAVAKRKEKTKKSAPRASASSSAPMLASKLTGEDSPAAAKPAPAPPKESPKETAAEDDAKSEYEYYEDEPESPAAAKPAPAKTDAKPEDEGSEYEYYEDEPVTPNK